MNFVIQFRFIIMDEGSYLIGLCSKDWTDILTDEPGTDVISLPRVTIIPKHATILTTNVKEEDEPKASRSDEA